MGITSYQKNGTKNYLVQVKVRNKLGKQIYRSRQGIKSEREAEKVEFELKKEIERELDGKPRTSWVEWVNFSISRMKLELRVSTCINYEKSLGKWVNPIWEDREVSEITKSDVHAMVFDLFPAHFTLNSRRTLLKMIRRIFQMAVEEGVIDRNPTVGITVRVPESDQKVLNSEEVGKLLTEAKICGHRFFSVWVVALMTGMRSGELYALEWKDIDFETRLIRVSRQWTNKCGFTDTKTRRTRVVPINEDLMRFLKEWRLKAPVNADFVLPRLKEWENGEQAQVIRDFCISIGITPIRFHDLRATFITNLLSRGVSLARVMAIVGHTQLKTTNCYLRKAGVELKGATDQLGYEVPRGSDAEVFSLRPTGSDQA